MKRLFAAASFIFLFFLLPSYSHNEELDTDFLFEGEPEGPMKRREEEKKKEELKIEAMIFIKGGCYEMGDTFGDGSSEEKPVHTVCVDDFYMGRYEVTVGEFRKFADETGYKTEAEKGDGCFYWTGKNWEKDKSKSWRNPGFSQTGKHPVVCVSWNDAIEYANWMGKKAGKTYRLPTEAEWEYAARSGGKNNKYSWGNGEPSGNIADEAAKRQFSGWTIWTGYDDGLYIPHLLGLLSQMTLASMT